jgi:hypothetical protein
LDVSTWRLPEPEIVSIQYYDTISYPEYIAVLHDDIIVSGYDGTARAHFDGDPSIHRDYHLHTDVAVCDLKTIQNKLMVFPHSHYLYLDDEYIDLKHDTGRIVCETPTGFVVLSAKSVKRHETVTGLLQFYENGSYTHTVDTPCLWTSMTWVGEKNVAFAATRVLQGIAEVTLLSIDGKIIRVLFEDIHPWDHMGISVLYDPVWEEYLISGNKKIMAFSLRNYSVVSRIVYEYDKTDNSYFLRALAWHKHTTSQRKWPEYEREKTERTLLFCIRNKSLLVRIQMK